ncbi:MAG: T9SS type A sorting domain-containing protein [Bacteroidia bacterium]|nr:T9SS type A sorting domain-containing protein [Bacteroidia bacterium]
MKNFFLFFFFILNPTVYAQQWEWAKQIPCSVNLSGVQILTDNVGNLYFKGSLDANGLFAGFNLNEGTFIAKFNSNGQVLWTKNIQGISKVKIDSKGILYITGTFNDSLILNPFSVYSHGGADIYFGKINSSGQILLLKTFGGSNDDAGVGLDIDKDDEIYLTGMFHDSIAIGTINIKDTIGFNNFYVTCLDTSLNTKWVSTGNWNYAVGIDIAVDKNKNSFVWGKYADTTYMYSGGDFISKFNSLGMKTYSDEFYSYGDLYNIEVNNSNVYLHGYGCNPQFCTALLRKYDPLMNQIWAKYLGDGYDYFLSNGIPFENGNMIIAGGYGYQYEDSVQIDSVWILKKNGKYSDLLVAKVDSNGNYLWFMTAGGNGGEWAEEVALDKFGNCFVYGSITNYQGIADTVIFDYDTLIGSGNQKQFFLAKINQPLIEVITAINEITELFSVFPNPSSGIFTVNLKNKTVEAKISVYDVLGNCVLDEVFVKNNSLEINLSNQPKGVYFIEIMSEEVQAVKKIVLQ